MSHGPTLPVSMETHATKYRLDGESFEDTMTRNAWAMADDAKHFEALLPIFKGMRFMAAGRVQAAMGSPRRVTPYNCFTGDTKILTREGVMSLKEASQYSSVELLDGNKEWTHSRVYAHGRQKTYHIRFTNGKQECILFATPDHDWIVDGREDLVKTEGLKIGDRIPHLGARKNFSKDAIIHGLIYGDGTATKDGGYVLHVCAEHDETYEWLDGYPYSETDRGRLYYFFGERAWAEFKSLPERPSPEYVVGFIRGLFLADGCISKQPEYLITGPEEVYEWLKRWGPLGGFVVTGRSKLADETNFGPRTRDTYNIRFDLRSLVEDDVMKNRDRLSYPINSSWRVADIFEDYEYEVFCPDVPTTHSFVLANGMHVRNCFVSQTITDSMTGIMDSATKAAQTMRLGGGIGYDFSTLRPRGDRIVSLDSRSSGPVSFMGIFDAVCYTIASAGHRRGAQMAVLRVDHPDILEFIRAKQQPKTLEQFNISVGVTDWFMECLQSGEPFELEFDGVSYGFVDAANLWEEIMRSTWDWAEPGVLFIDRINEMNNLWYCEELSATNPCGEQPLPPNGACLLGSFNLAQYIHNDDNDNHKSFDWHLFEADIPHIVRAMDNIIDKAVYPLPEQEKEAKDKRRMGLGVTGLANAGEVLGFPYGSDEFVEFEDKVLNTLKEEAYKASARLAKEKGVFPLYDKEKYMEGRFIQTLSKATRKLIRKHGIRNSHLTSIAPTGTISLCADNVSSGIEPVFAMEYTRALQKPEGPSVELVTDYGYRVWGVEARTTLTLSAEDHLRVLAKAQEHVDSAVSKTCNVSPTMDWEEFKNLYINAWKLGCKGITTHNPDGKRGAVLVAMEDDEGAACWINPDGSKSCE